MKFRPGSGSNPNVNDESQPTNDEGPTSTEPPIQNNVESTEGGSGENATNTDVNATPTKRSVRDIGHKVGKQIDVLDSLIQKSERAELAMHQQNREMKRHLK